MAGRGPQPKVNRRRANAPARGDWTKLQALTAPVIPGLDTFEPPAGVEAWPGRSVSLWDSWREDPATALWTRSDLTYAVDTIDLHASAATAKASEIRIRMESLGLTPKGRADRRLLLPDEEEPEEQPSTPATDVHRLRAI